MGNLLIDLGNTRLKWRLQQQGLVTCSGTLPMRTLSLAGLHGQLPEDVSSLFWASVASDKKSAILQTWALEKQIPCHQIFTQDNWQGLINGYQQAAQLGVDRWLAMVAARQLTHEAVCVVDCGSAITFDYVRADGCHEGGYIIPGARLMSQALTRDTANINVDDQKPVQASAEVQPGTDTFAAVFSGCNQMALHGVCGLVREAQLSGYDILVCGGDGIALADKLSLTYVEGLVLDGLAEVAELHKH